MNNINGTFKEEYTCTNYLSCLHVKYVVKKNFQQYQAKSFYTRINKDHILVALEKY